MMFKNSCKLVAANFSIVWKLILYYILVTGITIGLIAPFFGTIGEFFNASGTLSDIGVLLTKFNVSVNPFDLIVDLNTVVTNFLTLFFEFFATKTWVALYLCFIVLYIFPVLLGLADLAVGQTLFGYMSSLTRYSFVGSYMKYFARSARFQLFKNLVMLPVNLLIVTLIVLTLRLSLVGGAIVYFMPLIVVAVLITLMALKKTFFAGWMPAIVVYDCNMFKGFSKGLKAVMRRFSRIFSNALVIMLLCVGIIYLFGTFASPILIPFFAVFFYVFEMVMFFGSQGMRYYVDLDTILSPKRLEESDSFRKVKQII